MYTLLPPQAARYIPLLSLVIDIQPFDGADVNVHVLPRDEEVYISLAAAARYIPVLSLAIDTHGADGADVSDHVYPPSNGDDNSDIMYYYYYY